MKDIELKGFLQMLALCLLILFTFAVVTFFEHRKEEKQKKQMQKEIDSLKYFIREEKLRELSETDTLISNEIKKDTADISDALEFFGF